MRPTKAEVTAIRRLDIAWAHKFMISQTGQPFVAAHSEITGLIYSADDVALLMLHKQRVHYGTKRQRQESRIWLAARGVASISPASPLVRAQ